MRRLAQLHAQLQPVVHVHPAVADAVRAGAPVVALESTIITHGMPFPDNLATARAVEGIVRDEGAVPATIGIVDGRCVVGLDDAELERLARAGGAARKVSRRDLADAIAGGGHGGTTVSATMILAHAAGIRVFVTGGVGGVHRGGEDTMDVSADLTELARTPVAVVCAGVRVGAQLARAMSGDGHPDPTALVVGGAVLDVCASPSDALAPASSAPGRTRVEAGGVGRNVACNLAHLGVSTSLASVVGDDAFGAIVRSSVPPRVVPRLEVVRGPTATYTAVHDAGGDLVAAVADMTALDAMTPAWVAATVAPALQTAALRVVIMDANLRVPAALALGGLCADRRIPLWLEPVSVPKARAHAAAGVLSTVHGVTPNALELRALAMVDDEAASTEELIRAVHALGPAEVAATLGADGMAVGDRAAGVHFFPAVAVPSVRSTRGAGDAAAAAYIAARAVWGEGVADAAHRALAAAARAVQTDAAVVDDVPCDARGGSPGTSA